MAAAIADARPAHRQSGASMVKWEKSTEVYSGLGRPYRQEGIRIW